MKVIVAGSREVKSYELVERAIEDSGFDITEVVCGAARGVDSLGAEWAQDHGVPVKYFPAEWKRYGRAAGSKRNEQMAEYAEALIAIPIARSKGTKHMISAATKRGMPMFVVNVDAESL